MPEKAAFHLPGGKVIPVLFNPNQYELARSNQLAEVRTLGTNLPQQQYTHGNSQTLTLELFFDTYEQRQDVRRYTQPIYALLEIDPQTHAPPICTFRWGSLAFTGVVESVTGKFLLFLRDGTPVRARLNLQMKEQNQEDERSPTQSDALTTATRTHTVQQGDTLSSIAAATLGSASRWRELAAHNRITNPRRLPIGTSLRIPPGGV